MADEWSQYAVKDEWSQYAETSPKLTGNPSIDMAESNKELATAKKATEPLEILNKVTGYPYTNPRILAENVGNIVKPLARPLDTSMAILNAATHPVDALSSYIGRYSPENIKTTIKTDPLGVMMDATVIGGITTAGVKAGIKSIPQATPEQLISKAENITQRILNPSKDVIADSLLKNSKIPAVREMAKVIRKSPNEKVLLTNIDEAIKTNFKERQAIFESNNYKMTDNHIKALENFINQRKSQGQVSSAEVRQMETVLAEEKAWYIKNQDKFDRISGQSRKEYLQDLTKTLIDKRADGSSVITQPARKQALDILRDGLKTGVEGNDIRIRDLNSTYAGLKDAKEMLANQAAIVEQNANKGIVDRLLLMTQGISNPQAAAIKIALDNANNIKRLSGQAERLMQKAMKNRVSNVIKEAVSNEHSPILGIPDLTPKYLKERSKINIESLGTKPKASIDRPYQIKGVGEYGVMDK